MASRPVSWSEVYDRLSAAPQGRLFGIPRGGAVVAGLTGRAVDDPEAADWIVDDLADSGATAEAWSATTGKPVWVLFDRDRDGLHDNQLVMPWERHDRAAAQRSRLERIGSDLLETLGYDAHADGLRETPQRWARWWQEFHAVDATTKMDATFDVSDAGRLVLVTGLRLWSMCEHHLLPFSVDAAIGYVPKERVLGLSKFARLSARAARRLQMQERLTVDIADATCRATNSPDVAVVIRGRHQCMEIRGARAPALATTFVTRGAFSSDQQLRAEFIALERPATC